MAVAGLDARYDFGRNWGELAARLDEDHVARAATDLKRLVGDVAGRTFLDLGCGSGLHAAAALRLGAASVTAVDYDPRCVEVTRATLARFAPGGRWQVERADALAPQTLPDGAFDIVYSWGVLHHTGDMWTAVRNAAALVVPGGTFAIALYVRTPLCGVWRVEKRLYSRFRWLRPVLTAPFVAALLLKRTIFHRDTITFVRDYRRARGMEFLVDVDDWLGGYPYESVVPNELEGFVHELGFQLRERFNVGARLGLFGTGCGEWRFTRRIPAQATDPER